MFKKKTYMMYASDDSTALLTSMVFGQKGVKPAVCDLDENGSYVIFVRLSERKLRKIINIPVVREMVKSEKL